MKKESGILIHPTMFPGPDACGDLGKESRWIIDLLSKTGQTYLQVLSIGPTDFSNSPYSTLSSFAGNPYMISLETLVKEGLLDEATVNEYYSHNPYRADYGALYHGKTSILKKAWKNSSLKGHGEAFETFCRENEHWLADYSLFMALKEENGGRCWIEWPENVRFKKNITEVSPATAEIADFHKFIQFLFFKQWKEFHKYASSKNIKIIGDIPIYVSYDSADLWGDPSLFMLNEDGTPTDVSGVPADPMSAHGQRWGGPLYKWEVLSADRYKWWKRRLDLLLTLVDCVKIDHFRGFESFWAVPFTESDPDKGRWIAAPGHDFFGELKNYYGEKFNDVIIVEDLGSITPEVNHLRDSFELSGMKIIQFINFSNEHEMWHSHDLPDNHPYNCVAYTGTHDNDIFQGWFEKNNDHAKWQIMNYFGASNPQELNMKVIEKLFASKAAKTIVPIQDILSYGSDSRMNTPGTFGDHNWTWRLTRDMIENNMDKFEQFRSITEKSGRLNG